MKKIFKSLILCLFLISNAYSGDIGEGEFKMDDFMIDWFQKYIKTPVGSSPETFVVATDGSYAMYWYCASGSCLAGGDNVKIRQCEIKAGTTCKTFARGRTIKWKNGINPGRGKVSRVSSKWSKEELVAKLTELGFVGNSTKTTTTNSTKKKEEPKKIVKKKEVKGERSVAISWDGYEELIIGTVGYVESDDGKTSMNLELPNNDGSCEGTYLLQNGGKGTWLLACSNNMGAAGTLNWNDDGSVTGSGRDYKDKKVKFTVGKRS